MSSRIWHVALTEQPLQDKNGRTVLHVAATNKALEVVSMICKIKTSDVNPIDGYGNTPLDNARMVGSAPIAALLERAGAKSGSDPALATKARQCKEWVVSHTQKGMQDHLETVLSRLPEQQQAALAANAVQHLIKFIQVHHQPLRFPGF